MFDDRHALAVSPGGQVTLPPSLRKTIHRNWGQRPELLCFGVQFLYICHAEDAEALLRQLDLQLRRAFSKRPDLTKKYFHILEQTVLPLSLSPAGQFTIAPNHMEFLQIPHGGLLTLLGVNKHLELWNQDHLSHRSASLENANQPSVNFFETPICLARDKPCSFLRAGLPDLKRCGDCLYLRLP